MNKILILLLILAFRVSACYSQKDMDSINNTIISSLPEEVEVLALGDPTHQEGTITKYRIDLIKKLVKEKGFRVIAIESNMLELYEAHKKFLQDKDYRHYERAIYAQLNASEMEELYDFVYEENKKGNPVQFVGFDSRFSGSTFTEITTKHLASISCLSSEEKEIFLSFVRKANKSSFSALFRNNKRTRRHLVKYARKTLKCLNLTTQSKYFFAQTLQNMIFVYEESSLQDRDDISMSNNVFFLQEQFGDAKIILFGSSTHLLKNPLALQESFFQGRVTTTAGEELNKKIGKKYHFIAYTALSGEKFNMLGKAKTITPAEQNSIEYEVSQSSDKIAFYITPKTNPLSEPIMSRFLGHYFDLFFLWESADSMVLIRDVKPFKIKKIEK